LASLKNTYVCKLIKTRRLSSFGQEREQLLYYPKKPTNTCIANICQPATMPHPLTSQTPGSFQFRNAARGAEISSNGWVMAVAMAMENQDETWGKVDRRTMGASRRPYS